MTLNIDHALADKFALTDLRGLIDRANELLSAAKEMQLSWPGIKQLADAQMQSNTEGGDVWEALAWKLAYHEAWEQVICSEDSQSVNNGNLP
jgi:hypothetical protein